MKAMKVIKFVEPESAEEVEATGAVELRANVCKTFHLFAPYLTAQEHMLG